MTTSVEGTCRCGKIRFKLNAEPMMTMACHCTGCQRMTASAFSLSSLFPSSALEITASDPVLGGLKGGTRHYFCPECMSWIWTRPEGMDEFVNVRSTMLADAAEHRPFIETWTREKLPWAVSAALHSFETVPDEGSIPALLLDFAEQARTEISGG